MATGLVFRHGGSGFTLIWRWGNGKGASASTVCARVDIWGLKSPKSEKSPGGIMREGVNGFDESMALGDSMIPVWVSRLGSCDNSSLRREPPRRWAP